MPSEQTILFVWGISIVLFLVVGVVVGFLLENIRRTAARILAGAEAIWIHGQLVANNTIQIPIFLSETRRAVAAILQRVQGIGAATAAIAEHAASCPGCPHCVLGRKDRT